MRASVESNTKKYKKITNEEFKETFVAVEKNDLQSKDSMTTDESPDDLTPTHSADIKDLLSGTSILYKHFNITKFSR